MWVTCVQQNELDDGITYNYYTIGKTFSEDGITWDTIEGYDCRLFQEWEDAYVDGIVGQNSNKNGNPDLVTITFP